MEVQFYDGRQWQAGGTAAADRTRPRRQDALSVVDEKITAGLRRWSPRLPQCPRPKRNPDQVAPL
jgi:hypothetical protein